MEYKNKFNIFIICLFIITVLIPYQLCIASCICEDFSIRNEVIKVNSVQELQSALITAYNTSGNKTIILEKGTYQLNNNLLYISPNMRNLQIIGNGTTKEEVIIRGLGHKGSVTHIFNVAASNFYCANLTLGWVSQHPIQIHGESEANYSEIKNVKIVDGNEQFIKISADFSSTKECVGGTIECCEFEFTQGIAFQYYTGGIDGHRCTDWLIRNNTLSGFRSPDGNLSEHAIHFWSQSKNIIVENNIIFNCDRGIGFGLTPDPSRGNYGGIIRNNFVHTNRDVGIGIENTPDAKIYNNTIWTDNYFNSIEYRFPLTTNVEIFNNLTNTNISKRDGATATLKNNYSGATIQFFIDARTYDYHLTEMATEAIQKGIQIVDIDSDIDCDNRNTIFDIGADQYSTLSKIKDQKINNTFTIQYIDQQ
ncbi:MAG: hypothetical protein HOP11_08385, partial [Saprospiraceae bacterium]|nr:hypothetical protein [Saprospiraceae bacterium]